MLLLSACGAKQESKSQEASATPAASDNAQTPEASKQPEKQAVTIKFMQYTASGSQEDTLKAMIAEFEKANPDVKVDAEVVDFKNYYTKLNTGIASGSAPDVFEVGYENFTTYASQNVLMD